MDIPKPITRVEQYLAHISGMRVNVPEAPLTREERYLAAWAKKSGIEDAEIQGDPPLTLKDCIGEPFKGLVLYGKSTQDGTPTPDAPVPIVSAGDGGSVKVKVTGKNLFPVVTQTNLSSIVKPDGGIRYGYTFYIPAGSTVTITGNGNTDTNCFVGDFDTKTQKYTQKSVIISEKNEKKTTVLQSGWYVVYMATDYMPHTIEKLNTAKIQIEIGTEATEYEPYREQLLVLQTPTGLRGIPVTSGGNYTDPTGQQWICDEVDLERGVYVQNTVSVQVNTKNGKIDEPYRLAFNVPVNGGSGNLACFISVTPFTSWTSCIMKNFFYLKNVPKTDGSFYTAEELKALALDVDIVYPLATPIETPLSEADIAAYRALTTYRGTTILESECGLKVIYSKLRK